MGTIFQFNDRIQSVNIKEVVKLCIQQTAYEIIAFNSDQLNNGLDSTGSKITPVYDKKNKYYGKEYPEYRKLLYPAFKNELNPKPGYGTPDLFLTGEFYKGIGVVVSDTEFTVNSTSEKAPRLELEYGSKIYGMTPENKSKYATQTLQPTLNTTLRAQLGL